MKKLMTILMVGLFSLTLAGSAFANCGKEGCPLKGSDHQCAKASSDCPKKGCPLKDGGASCAKADEGSCPITGKFMKKAEFFLSNKDEVALSEDQVKMINALKLEVEKISVRQCAEMKIFMLDLMAKLHEDKVDVEGINAMMDQGSVSMTESGKAIVANYAKLKELVSPEQMAKLKEIWKKNS